MAKTTKFNENTKEIFITPKSKNITWEYTGSGAFTFDITVNYDDTSKNFTPYDEHYRNFATKSGNDLVVTTIFYKTNGKFKTIKNTIKNYFSSAKNDLVRFSSYELYSELDREGSLIGYKIKPTTVIGDDGLYGEVNGGYILVSKYTTSFNFNTEAGENSFVYNTSGNNKYIDEDSGFNSVLDLKGKDEYTLNGTDSTELYIYDLNGKDTYTVTKGNLYVEEYNGNEEYTIKGDAFATIGEKAGNDTYKLNDAKENISNLFDVKGNDKYYLTDSNANIVDQNGKDYYEIKNIDNSGNDSYIEITDDGSGKDKYVIKDSNFGYKNSYKDPDIYISDSNGNDKYEITNVVFDYTHFDFENVNQMIVDENGKDTYKITNLQYAEIKDKNGNDKYIIKNSNMVNFIDEAGNDNYSISKTDKTLDMEYIGISDSKGSDKYTITGLSDKNIYSIDIADADKKDIYKLSNIDSLYVNDKNNYTDKYSISATKRADITDDGGKDSYNFKQSTFSVEDNGSDNDKYKVDTLKIIDKNYNDIDDKGGNKDSLTISNLNKNNIVYMMDYWTGTKSDHYRDTSSTLIIYDKENKGFVKIYNFYKDENHDGVYEGYGDGRIETIKAGKKTLKDIPEYTHFNEIAEQVGAWLDKNATPEYGLSVATALTSDKDISELIQIFQGG